MRKEGGKGEEMRRWWRGGGDETLRGAGAAVKTAAACLPRTESAAKPNPSPTQTSAKPHPTATPQTQSNTNPLQSNPIQPNQGHLDGLLCLWDLRQARAGDKALAEVGGGEGGIEQKKAGS